MSDAACFMCGCTDSVGCDEGCYWVGPELCSVCAGVTPATTHHYTRTRFAYEWSTGESVQANIVVLAPDGRLMGLAADIETGRTIARRLDAELVTGP